MGELIGYARVSTRDQKPHLQIDALRDAGCERIFEETASGARRDRPELAAALDFMRGGDSLAVWKLDRLARSTRQLLETVEALERRGIGLKILPLVIYTHVSELSTDIAKADALAVFLTLITTLIILGYERCFVRKSNFLQ